MVRHTLARHSGAAAWLLMVVLTLAPSLALAAMACVQTCCPAEAVELADCSAGFARQACCSESPDPLAPVAPTTAEVASLHALLPGEPKLVRAAPPWRPTRAAEAELALRTSPFRLSVVLLI